MQVVYTVNTKKVCVYNKPSSSGKVIALYNKGKEVTVYETRKGPDKVNYANTSKKGNKWINLSYLKKESSGGINADVENQDKAKDDTIRGTSSSSYNKLMLRYIRAFGSPPRFTREVDPYYDNANGINTGRAMMSTWFSDPAILSLCPGTVDYLPGFSKKQKNQFWNRIKSSMSGDVLAKSKVDASGTKLSGKLYAFKSAYADYINVVNLLCRVTADFLGIGDVDDIIQGSSKKLKNFDYGYYTSPSSMKQSTGIFAETKRALNTAVSDSSYVHFFINNNGTSVTEDISTQSESTWLETLLGDDQELSQTARTLQFLFGNALSGKAEKDIDKVLKNAASQNSFLGSLANISANYLKGGRLVFPKMISGMSYDKSLSVEMTFTSVYGDKRSIFKQTLVPAMHLLALATPKQLSDNMYTYPFLVRAYQKGSVNMDLAFIKNLEFVRGGADDASWTVDGLSTTIVARFQIVPLYSNLMVTSSQNPFLFLNNTSLMEYLGTMCGLDLKANNLSVKIKVAKNLIANAWTEDLTVLARGISDLKLVNEVRQFTQIIN